MDKNKNKSQLYIVSLTPTLNINAHIDQKERKGERYILVLVTIKLYEFARADFKAREIIRVKEGHCIITKGSILQEDITVRKVYACTSRTSNFVREKNDRTTIDEATAIVEDFNTPLVSLSKNERSKIRKIYDLSALGH